VGECALWAPLTGPQFSAQVAAVVSLVEAPANHRKASAVAKEVMAIMLGYKTGLLIEKFFESPFAGKHPKLIDTSIEAAAAEAAVTAAEAIAVADLEEAKRLAAKFEALGGGALTMALTQEAEPGGHLRECWLARERLRVSEARSINLAEILTARTDVAAEAVFGCRRGGRRRGSCPRRGSCHRRGSCRRRGGRCESRRRCAWRASGLGGLAAERAWWRRGRHGRRR
jgi:hypothetical protein